MELQNNQNNAGFERRRYVRPNTKMKIMGYANAFFVIGLIGLMTSTFNF
jgi:hypothetical protein